MKCVSFDGPNESLANIQNSVMDAIQNWSNFCVGDLAINLPMSSAKAAAVSWGKLDSLQTLITQKISPCAHVCTITTKFQFIQIFDTLILIAHFTWYFSEICLHLRSRLVTPGKWKPESMLASQSAAPRQRRQVANDNMKNTVQIFPHSKKQNRPPGREKKLAP